MLPDNNIFSGASLEMSHHCHPAWGSGGCKNKSIAEALREFLGWQWESTTSCKDEDRAGKRTLLRPNQLPGKTSKPQYTQTAKLKM